MVGDVLCVCFCLVIYAHKTPSNKASILQGINTCEAKPPYGWR